MSFVFLCGRGGSNMLILNAWNFLCIEILSLKQLLFGDNKFCKYWNKKKSISKADKIETFYNKENTREYTFPEIISTFNL